MPIRNKQLEDDPRRLSASASDPAVLTGEGAWYTKDVSGTVEGFYKDDQGNAIQMTSNGSILGSGAVDSVNSQTGTVVLDADDISPTGSRIWFTSAEQTKLSGVTAGAEPNPGQVSSGERTAGTETALRSFAPEDVRQMILTHSGGGGAVSSVNSETGAVVLTSDDISDTAQTNKWFTDSERTKLSGVATGAEVNPDVISQGEAEAGTATSERIWTAERVAQAIAAQASGGGASSVFSVVLPDAANLAARIALATVPSGWTITSADLDGETQFGSDTESLVIIWDAGLGTKIANITVYDNNTSAAAVGGIKVTSTSQSNPSNIKVNSSMTKAVVQFTSLGGLPSGRDVHIQVALS